MFARILGATARHGGGAGLCGLLALGGLGCSQGEQNSSFGSAPTDGGSFTTSESSDGASSSASDSGHVEITSIEIVPSSPAVEVVDGIVGETIAFEATAHYSDGTQGVLVGGQWEYDRPDLATIDPVTGVWTPTGELGGTGTVTVESEGVTASTPADVHYRLTLDPDGTPPDIKDLFDGANVADPLLEVLYPYDRTVFPRGLASPTMQWSGGADTDVYRIEVRGSYFSFETWQTVPNPSRLTLPTLPVDAWAKLQETVGAGEISVHYQRYDGTTAYLPVEHTWTLADASLTGAVYYWAVKEGDVLRLPVGATAPEAFLEQPPFEPDAEGQCIGCHSVSSDGSTIVASMYGAASPWGTWNAEDGTKIFLSGEDYGGDYYPADSSGFQAISPTGEFVITGQAQGGGLKLSQSNSTTALAAMDNSVGSPVHPAWSPDGALVAYGARTNGDWLHFSNSSLWVTSVDTVTPSFSGEIQLVPSDSVLPTATYPSFAPDSSWIAFNKATQAFTRGAEGELWMVRADGSVSYPLAEANGVADLQPGDQLTNFEPTFMPVSVGGYYWLIFVSERPYGNVLTDTNPDTRAKQLWVTAISADVGESDGSHPAFWLPGQDLDDDNMRGNWALSPCVPAEGPCESGFDCCDGFCIDGLCGGDAPCAQLGDACELDEDCCDPEASCVGGFCAPIIP